MKILNMDPVGLGLVAGAFTTFASLPQIVHVMKTRSMKDISLITLSMFALGVSLWLCYGVLIHSAPVILWNLLSLGLYVAQIGLKIALSDAARLTFGRSSREPLAISA